MRFIALLLLFPIIGIAQETITLEDCYRLVRENYPTVKKLDLVAKTEGYTLANANRSMGVVRFAVRRQSPKPKVPYKRKLLKRSYTP